MVVHEFAVRVRDIADNLLLTHKRRQSYHHWCGC